MSSNKGRSEFKVIAAYPHGPKAPAKRTLLHCQLVELLMAAWLSSLFFAALLAAGGCMSQASQPAAAKGQRSSKIAPELIALHEEYTSHLSSRRQEPFRPTDPLVQTVDGRVIIDAVAAGEASVLQADLRALGIQDSVSFGRIVSGQLPISSIPALATLSSLNFARAAAGITHKVQPPFRPQQP